jgi:tetratricopeptide (TPR) repeat protein
MSRRERTISRPSISDIEFNDRYSQASTYHQLGIVAQELREYEQARAHYQQALDIKIEFNDRYSQADRTYHQLGIGGASTAGV